MYVLPCENVINKNIFYLNIFLIKNHLSYANGTYFIHVPFHYIPHDSRIIVHAPPLAIIQFLNTFSTYSRHKETFFFYTEESDKKYLTSLPRGYILAVRSNK